MELHSSNRASRILACLLALCLAVMVALAAATPSWAEQSGEAQGTDQAQQTEAQEFEPYSFVDALGREITVDEPIERVAIVQVPILSTYIAYMGGTTDKLVGVSKNIMGQMKDSIFVDEIDGFMSLSSDCFADGKLNIEELVKLDADILIVPNGNADLVSALENAGLKAVAMNVGGDPCTLYVEWIDMLEAMFNEPGKMDACLEEGQKLIEMASEATADVTDKASVMVVYGYGNGALQVAGQGSRTTFWAKYVNFDDAAAEIQGISGVSMEQVIAWDPDVILLPGTGQCTYLPDDLYENKVEGADFSVLTAVQEGRVYCSGLGGWSWFTPSIDAPLAALWLACAIYPEQTADIDLEQITKDYYETYYHISLTDEEMAKIYPDYAGL